MIFNKAVYYGFIYCSQHTIYRLTAFMAFANQKQHNRPFRVFPGQFTDKLAYEWGIDCMYWKWVLTDSINNVISIIILKDISKMQALAFQRGKYYQIICKVGDQAMKISEADPTKYDKSQVSGTQPNENDNSQIWMIEKVGQGEDQFEFVNCQSALVFDEEGGQIKLRAGKQSKDQLFAVVQARQEFFTYYWIKTDAKGKTALEFEGVLRYKDFDLNKETQMFRFVEVKNPTVQQSALIINNQSGKALDVPGATWKKGERLIQWERNNRWNQRWRFVKQGKGVVIQSVLNGQCLDIAEQKKTSGAKVVQWQKNGGDNQLWIPEGNQGVYRFRSVMEPSLFLGIKKQNMNDGGELEVTSEETPSIMWRVEGALP